MPKKAVPFYKQLKASRLNAGLTQLYVAEKLGVWTRAVRYWESGERYPDPHHRKALQRLFPGLDD